MELIGQRIREERQRLKLTQEEFANIGFVQQNAQRLYEKGLRSPRSSYLTAIGAYGIDLLYVVTGIRRPLEFDALTHPEQRLVLCLRKMKDRDTRAISRFVAEANKTLQ